MRNKRIVLSGRMRELRIAAGLTTKEAAKSLCMVEKEYCRYESGKDEFSVAVASDIVELYQIDMLLFLAGKIGDDKKASDIAIKEDYDKEAMEEFLELADTLSQWQLALAITFMRRFQTPDRQEGKSLA